MKKNISNLSQFGILYDMPIAELPDNAWTEGSNVRVNDGVISNAPGYIQVFDPPTIVPYWCHPVATTTNYFWLYAGTAKIYATDTAPTHTNITRQKTTTITASSLANPTEITAAGHEITDGDPVVISGDTTATPTINGTHVATVTGVNTFTIPVNVTVAGTDGSVVADTDYSMGVSTGWNGGVLSGVLVANNGVDQPQAWVVPALATKMQNFSDVSDWVSTTTAKVVRPFKYYLIALDIDKNGTRDPYMVKWNHQSDPGTINGTWDETDTTKNAGENSLIGGGGFVIDGLALRDYFVIYREGSTWVMRESNNNDIFSFDILFENSGILAVNCAAEYRGVHYVLTNGDVVAHDGHTVKSIIDKKARRTLFNEIDSTNYKKSFVVVNSRKDEVWVCYPTSGSTYVNKALVYNISTGTWMPRVLPNVSHIENGVISESESTAWDSDSDVWDVDDSVWDQALYNPSEDGLMMAGTDDTKLYKGNSTNTDNGTNRVCYIERTGLQLGDYVRDTHITAIHPKFRATNGTQIKIYAGGESTLGEGINWSAPKTFTVGVDYKVSFRVRGRLSAVKFQTEANVSWGIASYEIEFKEGGKSR